MILRLIFAAKLFGLIAKKLGAPQVVGEIVAGLIIGPSVLGLVFPSDYVTTSAEIGVVLLMFMAGLTTNVRDLIKSGPMALLIACVGVFVPLCGGTLLYSCFYGFSSIGSEGFFRAVFIGVILTATSVSITVETLKELGKLEGRIGTLITGAAIIDDVIGIIVLTFVIGFKDTNVDPGNVLLRTFLFMLFCGTVGIGIYYLFKYIDKYHQHQRRIPILSLALCLAMAYIAETYFGIADITGAYVAGILLCNLKDSKYINEKMDISSYLFFGPLFFASIGIKTQFEGVDSSIVIFSICSGGTCYQDNWLRTYRQGVQIQLERLAKGRSRHDDPRRGCADSIAEGSCGGTSGRKILYSGNNADTCFLHNHADSAEAAV